MATDTTHLPQGELNTDAGNDMAGSELEFGAVQLAQVTADSGQPVQLPQGQQVVRIPVLPGQTLTLPTDSPNGLLAKIGPEGNLAIVIDGRTIIFQGYVQANDQSPVRVVTNDGDVIDVADVVAATDPSLDIQTAAGPATGNTGDSAGSGIYTPFNFGPALGGLNAIGVLDATALNYKLIEDERRFFVRDEDTAPTDIQITFDLLGGIVNEDDLPADARREEQVAFKLVLKDQGNNGTGNDPFDTKDRENQNGTPDDTDGVDDNGNGVDDDREPLFTVATVKVTFGDDVPGTLTIDTSELPEKLFSEGEPVIYEVLPPSGGQGNGILGFVNYGGDPEKYEEGIDRLVFDIKVQEDSSDSIFHVVLTLHDNLDNEVPDVNGDNEADLLGGVEEILDLPVKLTAEDSDGSKLSTIMQLGVQDDIPFFGEVHECYSGEEEGFSIVIKNTDADIVHDESKGVQWWDSDDQSFGDAGADAIAATHKATDAGFSLPYGDSIATLWPKGIAQTQVIASFGADGQTQEQYKGVEGRDSIFGALQDRADGTIDGKANGVDIVENEQPFELFMIKSGSGINAVPGEDDLDTGAVEGNLTIEDQPTNATVSWTPYGGETAILQVFLRQIDAQTIVGYVIPPEGEENPQESLAREVDLGNGLEAVFVITIDDDGKMTFVQYHQINHSVDGPTFPDHDDEFAIRGEDGTPVIQVRITDFDGDHATQPVNLVIQDDGPKFCGVDWGCDYDSKNGKGLIDEDRLYPNGNNDWAPGDDKGGKHADGKIEFDFGVDKPGHLEVHGLKVTDSAGVVLMNITVSFNDVTDSYDWSGLNDLKTADGHSIEIEVSVDGNGLLTLIGRDSVDDGVAFQYTLQTTGYDKGEFDFCLNEALYHPYTDSDSQNDGPAKSFEDNLKFELNVRGYDVDGDYANGSICINVDDDSPKAECDYECVVEGTHGEGELNYVTGNIVTGNGDTVFGNDANNLDGNADSPGADQPYTISQLKHGGDTYTLVDEGDGNFHAEKNGVEIDGSGDEQFDGSKLTIKTAEGGTLEIILVSTTQSEVGDYKYTVPENAQHDHDIEAGPESLAQSMSTDFDEVSEWQDSFAAAGITLIPSGGSLGLRDLNVSGPEYRGIGVGSSEGDNNEVDNNGPDEKLTLQIANPTNNIELTIGALYNGAPDGGAVENLRWEVYLGNVLVASGEILGTETGLVTLDIDTLLPFDKVVLKPSDNGEGESANNSDFVLVNAEICCPVDKFTEEFDYTLRDADGDEACSTLKVEVKDTEPTHEHGQPFLTALVVDEDGLPKGVGNTDSPLDDNEDHSAPNAPVDDAKHIGTIPFTPGADPTSIELTVLGGPDTKMKTLDNQKIFATWDSVTSTLIGYIEGTDPAVAANQVFKMQITDPLTGAYTFELLQAVKHENSEFFGIIDDTENLANLPASFIVVAEIEDKDCDVLFSKVLVTIDDDMPVIEECHDEQGNAINLLVNGSFEQLGTEDGGVLDRGSWGVFSKIPGWTSGNADDSSKAGLEIQSDGAVPQIDAQDGEHYAELDSDTLNPGSPAPSSTNASIYQDVDTQDGNNYVLSFFYSPREGQPTSDGIEVWFAGQLVATINSGTVGNWTEYKFVVEGGGDDLSRLEFKAVGSANSLGGFIDNVSLTACALVDEDDLTPNGIEGGPGDDGVGIGTSFNGSLGVNFGADEGKSIAFLESGQPNLKSGGDTVKYDWQGAPGGLGVLIAYTGGNPNDVSKQVFKVEVTSLEDGGQYTFTLLKPLDHPDTNNNPADNNSDNGKGSYEDNLIFELAFKATDRDDDTVKGHLQINVDDDSPTIGYGEGSITLAVDETKGGGADVPGGGTTAENDETLIALPAALNVYGPAIGEAQGSAAGLFTYASGADIPASAAFSLVVLNAATGMIDTATNSAVNLVDVGGGVVEGRSAVGNHLVFAFHVDGNGLVSMAQYRAVNHGDNEAAPGEHDEVAFFNEGVLGVNLKVTDKDGDAVNLTKDISKSISVDDDGPHATCDYDSVTEGEGNYASGNVVTGANPENAVLGTDANGTDGNADNPGQDKPYTISKLVHDGQTYELSDDGSSVSGLQPGDSYNNVTGVLTITTAEGATFEIVLKSATQSEVGEYKYTAGPDSPSHAEDVHVGPSVAQSFTDDFNSLGEWTTAFSNGGITLIPSGGALTIKDVGIAGPNNDYRGVGVTTGLDGSEVDTDNESLTLQFQNGAFPGGVNNAQVQIGALFDGVQYDAGSQEILRWEARDAGNNIVASGQIVGDYDGLVTLDIDTAVNFTSIVLTPLNNGAGNNGNNSDFVILNVEVCKQEPVCEEFGYTLRDGDGDESSATLKINVEDTQPTIPTTPPLAILVDEDGLPAGVGNTTSPLDADEGDAGDDDAKISGVIPFTPGADPVTIELSVGVPGQAVPGGGDTGLDTYFGGGTRNVYAAWDAATSTLIGYIQGTDPSDAANQVFKMIVTDHATGAFTFELLKPVVHPNTDAGGANNNTENGTDPFFTVNVQVEDKDCDVAFTTVKVTIDDDMPVIGLVDAPNFLLAVDESLDDNSSPSGGDDVPGGGTTQEDDEDHFNLPDVLEGITRIGEAQASAANLFSVNYGADGPQGGDKEYSLVITNGGVTGLFDTQSGLPITLYAGSGDTVVGRIGGSNGTPVFAFHIDEDTGLVSMAQYRAINHGAQEPAPGEHDEVITLPYDALSVKLLVSDRDTDGVAVERDISQLITFDDDGPDARNDTDNIESSDGNQTFFAAGNVITPSSTTNDGGDKVGTDLPGKIIGLSGVTSDTDPAGNFVVQGLYGTLTMQENGNYNYNFDETKIGSLPTKDAVEVFTYTLSDKDGDSDSATLTIKFPEAKIPDTKIGVGPQFNGVFKEDVSNAVYFQVDPQQSSDTVVHVKITGLINWDLGAINDGTIDIPGAASDANITFNPITGVLEFDIVGAAPGETITAFFNAIPPQDTDVDSPVTIVGTVQDGPVTATGSSNGVLVVDAILDQYVDVTGAAKVGVEQAGTQFIALGLTGVLSSAGFAGSLAGGVDGDSSESHAVKLVFNAALPAGTVVEFAAAFGSVTQDLIGDPTGKTYLVTPNALANLDDLIASIGLTLPAGFDGAISGHIDSSSKEANTPQGTVPASGSEPQLFDNTKTDTADFSVTISPKPDVRISVGLANEGHCIFEDTPANFVVNAATDAASHLTSVVLTGLPVGWTYDFTGLDTDGVGGNVVVDLSALALGEVTINFPNGNVENYNGTFVATPPADSDLDFGTLNGEVNAANDVNPAVTASTTDSGYFETDAVADGKGVGFGDDGDSDKLSVSLAASDNLLDGDTTFAPNEEGTLTIGATFDDYKDGSEKHQVTIAPPAGFEFLPGTVSGLPAGVTVDPASTATNLILNVASNDSAGSAGFANVQVGIKNVGAADASSLEFTATATAEELNKVASNGDGNKECTDDNNLQSVSTKTEVVTANPNKLPIAYDDKVCGDEPAPRNVNILLILDRSGSMGDVVPNSGGLTRLQLLQQATAAMLNTLAANGDVRVMVIGFTTNAAEGSNGQWVDVATAIAAINALTPDSLTNYEDALEEGAQAFNSDTADRGDFATHDNLVFFMSDGVPTTGGDAGNGNELTNANKQAWDNFLENPANSIDQLTVVGIGADIAASDDDLEDVADPDYTPDDVDAKNPFGEVLIVADENDLKDALTGSVATSKISGDVLDGSIENSDPQGPNAGPNNDPDNQGDGPAFVSFLDYDHLGAFAITVTWDGIGSLLPGDVSGGDDVSLSGTKVSFDTEFGRMTFDMATGKFDFFANPISGGDKNEHFTYAITDSNGDVSNQAALDVCIQDAYVDLQPVAFDNHDALNESAVTGSAAVLNSFNGSIGTGNDYGEVNIVSNQLEISSGGNEVNYDDLRDDLIAEGLSGAALDALVGDEPNEGSAFVRAFNVAAPSVLRFEYDYAGDGDGNDIAVYFVIDSVGNIVSQGVLGEGSPDSTNTLVTVPLANAGDYKVIFVSLDREDDGGSTELLIDYIETQPATINTVGGNVITDANDTPSGSSDPAGAVDTLGDPTNRVSQVQFGATIVAVPSDGSNVIINGANGVLTINSTGLYTYTSFPGTVAPGVVETDAFTYTLRDTDGDTDTAILRLDSTGAPGTITIGDIVVNEGGTANIVVTLSEAAPVGGITLNYTFAGGTATVVDDYTAAALGATVFIPAGATTANIQVNAKTDGAFDDNETYNVVISGAPVGWIITDSSGLVTINDTNTLTAPSHSLPSGWSTGGAFGVNDNPYNGSDSGFHVSLGNDNDVGNANGGNDWVEGEGGDDDLSGGQGNDRLDGEDNNDILRGNQDNDLLIGGAGFDKYEGGSGNDWIIADSGDLAAGRLIDGGSGDDVLELSGVDFNSTTQSSGITNIEVLTLEGSGDDDITLNVNDVIAMTDGDDTLFVLGSNAQGDSVALTGGGWSKVGDDVTATDGIVYDVYKSGAATVAIENELSVTTA